HHLLSLTQPALAEIYTLSLHDALPILQAEDYLAEDEQLAGLIFAVHEDDNVCGYDGDDARDKTPQPGRNTEIKISFHYDLSGQCSGNGRTLSRRDQRNTEQYRCPF